MTISIAATIALFPLYLLIREPFRRLPLHIDTGFYVSNHTIARKHFDFSKGWNAHYAGCSKVVPEVFYSTIYLLHGPEGYARWSRVYASLLNYATAIAVGLLTSTVFGYEESYYVAGLVAYALLSGEPHWGGYFECGEHLHVLTDVTSMLMLLHGVNHAEPLWVTAAAFTYVSGACFIKLSALIALAVVFGGAGIAHPNFIVPMAAGAIAALQVFAAWVRWNDQSILALLGPLRGHEREFSQGSDWGGIAHRLREKDHALFRVITLQPWLMMLAVLGLLFATPEGILFWLYAGGCLAAYVAQATDCRYYLIPMLPAFAVLAAGGALALLGHGLLGVSILSAVVITWIFWNPIRAYRLPDRMLNLWCWSGGIRAEEADRNFVLQQISSELRNRLGSESVLIYGPRNQAYALLGASYETPLVAAEVYLDSMVPAWQDALNRQLLADPPKWIVDTGRCFRAKAARDELGLDYRMSHIAGDSLQVYRHVKVLSGSAAQAKTFAAISMEELHAERILAGEQLEFVGECVDSTPRGRSDSAGECTTGNTGSALAELLADLRRQGRTRLAIYGAGRFTVRHADIYRRSGIPITVVLDDAAGANPPLCGDWPVCAPEQVDLSEFDAVVISSDRFAGRMIAKLRKRWGDRVAAFVIPGCR